MPRQTAVRLHEERRFIDNVASRKTYWRSIVCKIFVSWWGAFSKPALFSDVLWQHLTNLINDSISASSRKEKIKNEKSVNDFSWLNSFTPYRIWVTEKLLVSTPALLIAYTNKEKGLETSNARATYVAPFLYSNCCSFQI